MIAVESLVGDFGRWQRNRKQRRGFRVSWLPAQGRRNSQECSAMVGGEHSDGGGSVRSLVAGGSSTRESEAEKR